FALISSNDSTITLTHMLHLVISKTALTLSWWNGASQNNIITCAGPTFPSNLLQDGTVYSISSNINVAANTVHIVDPFGQSLDCYDPNISALAGNLTIWEITDAGGLQSWSSLEQDVLVTQNVYGITNSSGGFQGALG